MWLALCYWCPPRPTLTSLLFDSAPLISKSPNLTLTSLWFERPRTTHARHANPCYLFRVPLLQSPTIRWVGTMPAVECLRACQYHSMGILLLLRVENFVCFGQFPSRCVMQRTGCLTPLSYVLDDFEILCDGLEM